MQPAASLSALPHEVLEEIGFRACAAPLLGPPTALLALLPLARRFRHVLGATTNPGFHARLFRAKFDAPAPTRRFRTAGQPLTAACFGFELRRRFAALKRIRSIAGADHLNACSEEDERADFWTVFLMFTESDGKNFHQLQWAGVTKYLRIYIRDRLMPTPRPGFPIESTSRSLGLWILWFLTEIHAVVAEPEVNLEQMMAMLRPWVFTAFKYEALYAPYTHYELPVPPSSTISSAPLDGEENLLFTPHYLADHDLRDRTEIVTHMGRRIRLAPPPASIAAILTFMVRLESHGPLRPQIPQPLPGSPLVPPTRPGLTIFPRTRYPAFLGPGSVEFDGRPNYKGSAQWDSEWLRIVSCGNPMTLVPSPIREEPKFRPGDLAGVWEGRFVFITFDAFHDMLEGQFRASQTSVLAQQPQVWRIREHHCISRRQRVAVGSTRHEIHREPLPIGKPLDAYIPADAEFIQHGEPLPYNAPISATSGHTLEIRVPDPTAPGGIKTYTYITRVGSEGMINPRIGHPIPSNYMRLTFDDTHLQAGQRSPQDHPMDDEWIDTITDTIITGEGHSSWGRFTLRGRIRHWDGMITLVKDYVHVDGQARNRWLYRGYIVGGSNWVGRWRETFTPEQLNGYEGVFSLTRRP